MSEWVFAQSNPTQQLARLHYFSTKKLQDGQEIEFVITVREYITPPDPSMKYLASTDKQTNQKVSAYTPTAPSFPIVAISTLGSSAAPPTNTETTQSSGK